jgi:DNA-binding response OmpR family regulator
MLDVVMPEMTGLDVLTRMKLHSHTNQLPVIMLTGESKTDDILAGYSVGADYYMTKPFTRQQLLYGINLVLSNIKA